MKYVSTFDKTVVAGDMVDYLSWGSLKLTNNLITRKSVNGSILMTTGNHEFAESCQPDIQGLPNQLTLEEKYARLQSIWSNDATYYEKILRTDSGKANVMMVLLDNGCSNYADGTAENLAASIEKAKGYGIPILIFQHIPMLTMNPNETAYYVGEGNDMEFATADNYTDIYDMTSKSGYTNPNGSNAETVAVCDLIRKNSDVIKGVFDGHEHVNMYTEIVAIDEEGNTLYDDDGNMVVIPQFTISAEAYGFVGKIVIN